MTDVWDNITQKKAPSWEDWAQYFVSRYPDIAGNENIINRFKHPRQSGPDAPRAGIVFLTKELGETVPVGLIVCRDENNGYFIYHKDYLASDSPPISQRMPKRAEPIELFEKRGRENEPNAMAFISNRGAEGWKSHLEALSLGQTTPGFLDSLEKEEDTTEKRKLKQPKAQLERLLTFGRDIPGAFWMLDIDLDPEVEKSHVETIRHAAIAGRSTLAGAQPKLLGVKKNGEFFPTRFDDNTRTTQLSTHIFKIATNRNLDVVIAEFLALRATKALLPKDEVVEGEFVPVRVNPETVIPALALPRFDRTPEGGRRHFTEMTEVMGLDSGDKFNGSFWHIARAINPNNSLTGLPYEQTKRLYKRVVGHFLVGNYDNHLKNFAVFNDTKTLTPNFDIEAGEYFGYKLTGLGIKDQRRTRHELTTKMLVEMGAEMGVTFADMRQAFRDFEQTVPHAIEAVHNAQFSPTLVAPAEVEPIRAGMEKIIHDRWERHKDYETVIDKQEATYRKRAERGIDIPAYMQRSMYAQFAPERLKRLNEKAAEKAGASEDTALGFTQPGRDFRIR